MNVLDTKQRMAIEDEIELFHHDDFFPEVVAIALEHRMLPVYQDMSSAMYVDRLGVTYVSLLEGDVDASVRRAKEPWILTALAMAAKRYSRLSFLAPPRPKSAIQCPDCTDGEIYVSIVCGNCSGLGWTDAE